MIGIIKTAIITIIISFISGVLLDFYKSKAPKVLCTIKKDKPVMLGGKKINAYSLRIKNASSKTIHDLNLNIQGHYDNLKIDDAKITKGLKFDISEEDEIYDVSIPFLCKDDEFTAKVFAYSHDGSAKKPFITLRSPEKFKKVYTEKESGATEAVCREVSAHKKAIAAIIVVLVIVYGGITLGEHFGKIGSKINVDNIKSKIESVKKPSGADDSSKSGSETKESEKKSNGSSYTKASPAENNKNTNSGSSSKLNAGTSQSKPSGNSNSSEENKKEENTASPADSGSDSGKSSNQNDSDKNKPVQKSENKSGADSNTGAAGDAAKQNTK